MGKTSQRKGAEGERELAALIASNAYWVVRIFG